MASSAASSSTSSPSRATSRRRCPRTSSGRGCCPPSTSGSGPAAASSSRSSGPAIPVFLRFGGIDYDHDDDAIEQARRVRPGGAAGPQRVRRQRPAADPGRQGRLPLRRVRVAARPRGRRVAGRGGRPRAARPREDDGGARHPDRHRPRPAAQRHLRPRDAADLRLPRRRRQPRRPADGRGARRADLRRGRRPRGRRRVLHLGAAAGPQVKGKADPVEVWSLNGSLERASRRKMRFELGLVGRRRELAELEARHDEAVAGRGRVVGIAAEAGMGKSRLVAEFVRNVRRAGHTVAFGECQAYGTKTPYFVWREIWRRLFDLDDERPGGAPDRRPAAAAGRGRSGPRAAHAAPRRRRRAVDPRLRPDARLRRQAAQDVARGPARGLPARPRRRGARRRRPRGLPLDRRAVAGPARAS